MSVTWSLALACRRGGLLRAFAALRHQLAASPDRKAVEPLTMFVAWTLNANDAN
jgi:hypothetical protein